MREEKRADKRDILRVQKDAEREIIYHYKREERLSLPSAPRLDYGRRSIFRNNRALLILFLDVILVIIIMFIAVRFFLGFPYKGSMGDYNFELKGFIYSGKVYISLVAERVRNREKREDSLVVSFYLKGEETGLYTVNKRVPQKEGEKVFLRVQIPFSDEETTVYAIVKMGGREITLHRRVQR